MRRRWWPLAVVVLVALLLPVLAWQHGLALEGLLLDYHQEMAAWVGAYPWVSAAAYMLLYGAVVMFALPGGTVMSLAGGYLFGVSAGLLLALAGATLGAMLTLWVVHSALGTWLRDRSRGRYHVIREAFMAHPVGYLLLLRLIPIFPFFAVNIAIALLNVRVGLYFWTTVVGLIPSTLALVFIGRGLGAELDKGELPGGEIFLQPMIVWPSFALIGMVVLGGVARQHFRKRRR